MTSTTRTVHSANIRPAPSDKRPYLRAGARRRQLLDAAGRLFDRFGFGGITMTAVAVEAGVSRQLVYDHFGDLEALYQAFVEDRLASYRAARPDISGLDPATAAMTMFRHLLTIPAADRRIVRLLVADVGLTALDHIRERFRTDELERWPGASGTGADAARTSAAIWATTSALLALADAVSSGDISDTDATTMAVGIVRSTRPSPRADTE